MTRVAIFSTYVPSEGFGGPSRIYHLRRVLESAGHPVTHVVVHASPAKGDIRSQDHVELVERPYRAPMDHIYHEVDLAARASSDPKVMRRIVEHIRSQRVGAILLEQPFLANVVGEVGTALGLPVVYSCQNVEFRLRRDLERFQPDHHRRANRSDEVRDLEVAAIELSTCVTAICPTDQQALRDEFGSTSTLVPNGTTVSSTPPTSCPSPSKPGRDGVNFVFAGSSYWPNIEGFGEVATPSLAFLPPTCHVDVAGSVGKELLRFRPIERHQSINASRMRIHGFLPMEELVDLMHRSTAVLVPVFVGEGSNLKSADALACGAPVIMTRRATRGYEDVIEADGQGVTIVDDAAQFRKAMMRAVNGGPPGRAVGNTRREMLRWHARLQPLIAVIENLTVR